MRTRLADFIKDTPQGHAADAILRKCVHCGFCTATCPTYQLLGDELDGPRGRIYLIKQVLEGTRATLKTQIHLDRCLTCRSCETTCPSGVQYAHLLDIGRSIVERQVGRPWTARFMRALAARGIANPKGFDLALKLGQMARPLLPGALRTAIPKAAKQTSWARLQHERRILLFDGCVQPSLAPNINAATSRVLDRLGISALRAMQPLCCGAVDFHLNAQDRAKKRMRVLIDTLWPQVEEGIEAIVFTATGCGVMLKDYAYVLAEDNAYRAKAERISSLCMDIGELLTTERKRLLTLAAQRGARPKAAFHSPCTLTHGLRGHARVEGLLKELGFRLTAVTDAHLCCGSAGTYSIFQPRLASQLKARKLASLCSGSPEVILSANIGCLTHLQSTSTTPVRHWIEALDELLAVPT